MTEENRETENRSQRETAYGKPQHYVGIKLHDSVAVGAIQLGVRIILFPFFVNSF